MGKTRILLALFSVSFSIFSFAAVEIYLGIGGFMPCRVGATLDYGNFYASAGIGYFPRLFMSADEFYTAEFRAGVQMNCTDFRSTFFVPLTFDLSIEVGIVAEPYFYTTGGYTANVGIECLAESFFVKNLCYGACMGVTVGIIFPILSVTSYDGYFSLYSYIPYNMMIIPEIGWVISF